MATTSTESTGVPLDGRRALASAATLFVLNGVFIGAYGGVLASLKVRLDLSAAHIGALLIASGVSAIVAMQTGGRTVDRVGVRRVALVGLALLIGAACTLAFASRFAGAIVGSSLLGLGGGSMDISMNALGVQIERARAERAVDRAGLAVDRAAGLAKRRGPARGSILSTLHALWSMGNFTGAGLSLAFLTVFHLGHSAVIPHVLLFVALVGAVGWGLLARSAPRGRVSAEPVGRSALAVPRAAYVLGVTAFAVGLSEGTAADWSSIHVTEVAHVDPVVGSLGLVAVSGCMVLVRLVGDRLVDRFGRRGVVRFGGACASIGYLTVARVPSFGALVLGWAVVGCGVGLLAPQMYGAAGHMGGGRVLAVVVTFGYAGFIAGPASIGFAARHIGLQHTMFLPAVLCIAVAALAGAVPKTGG